MIRELDRIVLTQDLDHLDLAAGDIGTVVLIHDGGRGYEVEFVTLAGETHAVTTLTAELDPKGGSHDPSSWVELGPSRRGDPACSRASSSSLLGCTRL